MPDPLLALSDFEEEYANVRRTAEFYGAKAWRDGRLVFFELDCRQGQRLLARLECNDYPESPPDLAFLNPHTQAVSARKEHWPPNSRLIQQDGELHLCLPGTRWFEHTHKSRGTPKDRSLARILEVLALCCLGQSQALTGAHRR